MNFCHISILSRLSSSTYVPCQAPLPNVKKKIPIVVHILRYLCLQLLTAQIIIKRGDLGIEGTRSGATKRGG